MPRIIIAIWVLLLQSSCFAAEINTPSGSVVVAIPPAFSKLDRQEIKAIFDRTGRLPLAAYADQTKTSTISVGWSKIPEMPLTPEQLPQLKQFMEAHLLKLEPRLKWRKSEILRINGKIWIHLESTALGAEFSVRSHSYITDLGGNMIVVNLSEPESASPKNESAFASVAEGLSTK